MKTDYLINRRITKIKLHTLITEGKKARKEENTRKDDEHHAADLENIQQQDQTQGEQVIGHEDEVQQAIQDDQQKHLRFKRLEIVHVQHQMRLNSHDLDDQILFLHKKIKPEQIIVLRVYKQDL